MSKISDRKNLRGAVYLRKSAGEGGTTDAQLERILPKIEKLEQTGIIKPLNRTIVGKDIDRKKKFDKKKDLAIIGDFYNEGESQSGFTADRPVLVELLRRVENDEYDIIIAETTDRFARDSLILGHLFYTALQKGIPMYAISEDAIIGYDKRYLTDKATAIALTEFGGLAKQFEIQKSKEAKTGTTEEVFEGGKLLGIAKDITGSTLEKGNLTTPELDWKKFLSGEMNIQQAYNITINWPTMTREGQLTFKNGRALSDAVGATSRSWARTWWPLFTSWERLGVGQEYVDNIQAMVDFLKTIKSPNTGKPYSRIGDIVVYKTDKRGRERPAPTASPKQVENLLKWTVAYRKYPAGVNLADSITFVKWPSPIKVGIEKLANTDDPRVLDNWNIEQRNLTKNELLKLEPTQFQKQTNVKRKLLKKMKEQ